MILLKQVKKKYQNAQAEMTLEIIHVTFWKRKTKTKSQKHKTWQPYVGVVFIFINL